MARTKSGSLKPFQKIITLMLTGKQVTIEEIEQTLGKEIQMYRLSTYIWHIKTRANGAIKTVKDGRKVVAYQLVNVQDVKDYMSKQNFASSTPAKASKVEKLEDLQSEKVTAAVEVPAAKVDVVEVTEVTQ